MDFGDFDMYSQFGHLVTMFSLSDFSSCILSGGQLLVTLAIFFAFALWFADVLLWLDEKLQQFLFPPVQPVQVDVTPVFCKVRNVQLNGVGIHEWWSQCYACERDICYSCCSFDMWSQKFICVKCWPW